MRIVLPFRPRGEDRYRAPLLFGVVAVGLVVLVSWLGWSMVGAGQAAQAAAGRELQVAELRGRIDYLDEFLTMSARMASVTGERRWIQRFEDAAPQFGGAVAAAADMASPEARVTLAATMLEAQRDLLQMERRALTLVVDNRSDEARSLMNGAEFGYIKDVYATGMEVLGQDLKGTAGAWASRLNERLRIEVLGFGVGTVLLVVALMVAQQRNRLHAAARTDVLTRLPNRRQFYGQLAMATGRGCATQHDGLTLLLVAVDRFKTINDVHGHARADRLLQLVAARLRAATSSDRPPARVGGDEFAVLIDAGSAVDAGTGPVREVLAALARPYEFDDGIQVSPGFSAGAVLIGSGRIDGGDVMRQADTALRQARADGRNCLRVFDHAMDERSRARDLLEADLRGAIARDEILPFFQPLVDLRTGQVIGVETLARWHHAERGWITPGEFIPLAEELGLIGSLMENLLRRACRDAASWPAHVSVAFNVSPLQLRDDALPGQIRAILAETAFPACRLEVEVTESALVQDLDLARVLLEDLRDSGIRLALDDFGTGYSSLKHLRCLPFDKLKIDAAFVGGMVEDPESAKIVAAVVGLGHSLGLSTVAEGVETPQVADLLRDLGCDIGQGWLYGRPVPAAALTASLVRDPSPVLAA